MAEKLASYDPQEVNPVGCPPKYPWHQWLDGVNIWRLKQGVDFNCQMTSMETLIRRTAARYGIPISLHREDNSFVIKPKVKAHA